MHAGGAIDPLANRDNPSPDPNRWSEYHTMITDLKHAYSNEREMRYKKRGAEVNGEWNEEYGMTGGG